MKRRELRYEDDCIRDLKFLSKIDRTIITDIKAAVDILLDYELLPDEYNDHPLQRLYSGYDDFHVRDPEKGEKPNDRNDVVVIYKLQDSGRKLLLVRAGSHSRLFNNQYSSKNNF